MIQIRHGKDRGITKLDWLDGRHTFSFGSYRDPKHTRYQTLRVINDDRIAPGGGFNTHAHDNMEIITYVMDGALSHKDSMGNGATIHKGDVQIMSAGSGVEHSEFNASNTDPVHLLQIWIFPREKNLKPTYNQKHFSDDSKKGQFTLIASPDGRNDTILIQQDVHMYACILNGNDTVSFDGRNKKLWVQIARGSVTMNDNNLGSGDGARVEDENLIFSNGDDAEILIFDFG